MDWSGMVQVAKRGEVALPVVTDGLPVVTDGMMIYRRCNDAKQSGDLNDRGGECGI